jgi:hypothetical protein
MLRANCLGEGACYTDLRTRQWVAINILSSCYRIGEGASLLRRLDELAALDFGNMDDEGRLRALDLFVSLEPAVLDAVRIATCFENLFKVRLLLRGYVIHQIDKEARSRSFKSLADEQRKRPIKISEIRCAEGLRWQRQPEYVFQSLSSFTLGRSTLLKAAYTTPLNLPSKLFTSLKDIVDKRNSLHFLANNTALYNRKFVEDLRCIRESFNRFIVGANNDLVKKLKFPDIHLKQEI